MDSAQNIPDSTDWLETPLKDFAQLENALHCQICKEFYDTPMITSCSHTFCSRCIRTSLSADGKCPACRSADQASKLRNNWALQEVVATFVAARPAAISVARAERELEQAAVTQSKRPGKRKRAVMDSDDVEQAQEGRTTRSKSRRTVASQTSHPDAIEIDDSDVEESRVYEAPPPPDDGLVECPMGCGKRMKIEQVNGHIDRCEDEQAQDKKQKRAQSRTPVNGLNASRPPSRQQSARPQERLAELNYSLLREQAMRKKLQELGIAEWGPKPLMIKRHVEWVNLWNANCDSNSPRSKRELLRELETWERTQGGNAPNTHGHGVMRKDFDGTGWANKHTNDFSRLIADAKRKKPSPATSSPKEDGVTEDPMKPASNGDERSSPHYTITSSSEPPPPQLTIEESEPYADNPDAMSSIREKVEAANAGDRIEPVMNEGFISQQPDDPNGPSDPHPNTTAETAADPTHLAPPGSENTALLAQGHFGHHGNHGYELGVTGGSRDEHSPGGRPGTPCELPAHLQSNPRKVPMFAVPSRPVEDVEMGGGTMQ